MFFSYFLILEFISFALHVNNAVVIKLCNMFVNTFTILGYDSLPKKPFLILISPKPVFYEYLNRCESRIVLLKHFKTRSFQCRDRDPLLPDKEAFTAERYFTGHFTFYVGIEIVLTVLLVVSVR